MFEKLLNLMFKEPKTMLDCALEEISQHKGVYNASSTGTNPIDGKLLFVGSKIRTRYNMAPTGLNIRFNRNDTEVMIRKDGDIVYFFNDPEEVREIRDAIITCYNNMP